MQLGIEIGGTKLQLGVGTGDGSPLIALERHTVETERGAAGILERIAEMGRQLREKYPLQRIGIGFGGPVRGAVGRVLKSHQVPGWDDFPLVDWCRTELDLPAVLGNDCDVAALAEARFGAGRRCGTVFYVTVGTGIGGGLVIDGKIHGTHRPAAAEIGHLRPGLQVDRADRTVESLAAGPGIAESARRRIGDAAESDAQDLFRRGGHDLAQLTARSIADAANAGNSFAREVFAEAARTLGWAVAQMITLVAPEAVVIGGGVSLSGEVFWRPLREAVRTFVFPPLAHSYRLVPAELGEKVVVHGALALAAENVV